MGEYVTLKDKMLNSEFNDAIMDNIIIVVSFISCLCLMSLGFIIIKDKNLRRYPYSIISWASLTDSILFCNMAT